jgi:hypothetical protein
MYFFSHPTMADDIADEMLCSVQFSQDTLFTTTPAPHTAAPKLRSLGAPHVVSCFQDVTFRANLLFPVQILELLPLHVLVPAPKHEFQNTFAF